ncbi:MAG: DNA primase [Candidatus Ozemobacter sibiricus]|uniref:DNA primase n=1 Tax=Candidatus Ozemobacter sibiricus TaxID=2268124 RepID=A0A367ZN58_9BACT|nr:MAG: DNA primase [Candidatus Ozemobacter sibiricus]
MAFERQDNVREYYRRITEVDIGAVARELLGAHVLHESDRLLQCDCPNHSSQSHRSLHVMLDKQGWYCFGCGVGGDVLQLVEFIQSGRVTRGQSGPMPESHQRARDFLAAKAGLPSLAKHGLSPEELAEAEAQRLVELRVHEVLTALAEHYHGRLKDNPEILEWLRSKYGLSVETIDRLLIGYADNDGDEGIVRKLTCKERGFSPRDLAASGAFRPTNQDGLDPFFDRRIVFPYWSRGRVVFMIGRKTPWTPDKPWEQGKYKKLPVHDENTRKHIAPCIDNSHLYNEDCLLADPERLIITEGVTDCISLMEHGFPAVSPVTVRIREADWERLLPRLRNVKTVYVCQDNEISQAGLNGALKTAAVLSEHRIQTRLAVLPLDERRENARRELRERFGLDAAVGARELTKRLDGRTKEEIREAERLLSEAKIDVNDYFVAGHSAQDFEELLAKAETPLEFGISHLPTDVSEEERNRLLEPILREAAYLTPLEQNRHLKLVQERFGKTGLSLATLREQVRAVQKEQRSKARQERKREKRSSDASPGSCRARIEEVLLATEEERGSPDFTLAAEAAYEWFAAHGARFFRTPQGEPFMFFEDTILWMDTPDRGRKRLYASLMYKHTGMVQTTGGGRIFYEVLSNLAVERGQVREHFSWLHTDVARETVYFNLNNTDHEIAKITPEGVEILKNGGNADGVILDGSRKMAPIRFLPEAEPAEADRLLVELLLDNLTCAPGDRVLILSWLSCFLLIDFAGTRPMTRFEGPAGSGKTTASKLISALLYGEPQQKKSTDAANYTDGSQNPLIVLDNIEVKQMTEDLTTFILTSITGIAKEKRKSGTDTETVIERTKCLLNTTGIEPLGGELAEILSRSFIIRFDMDEQASDCFLEAKILAALREHRDLIVSSLMKRTSHLLAMLRAGAQEKVMRLLHRSLGNHSKRRCNDYLSLMYLMMLAGERQEVIDRALEELHPQFVSRIATLNSVSLETARESNPIATCLAALFKAYRHALEADRESTALNVAKTNKAAFLERYQLDFRSETTVEGALARDLFVAVKRLSKDFGLSFNMNSVQQFAQRFSNDLDTIRQAGFEIVVNRSEHSIRRTATYDITYLV